VPDFRRTFHHPEVRVLGGLGRVSGVRRVHVLGENGWLGLFGSGTHVSRGTRIIMVLGTLVSDGCPRHSYKMLSL
jgi:hypothetical protein